MYMFYAKLIAFTNWVKTVDIKMKLHWMLIEKVNYILTIY